MKKRLRGKTQMKKNFFEEKPQMKKRLRGKTTNEEKNTNEEKLFLKKNHK